MFTLTAREGEREVCEDTGVDISDTFHICLWSKTIWDLLHLQLQSRQVCVKNLECVSYKAPVDNAEGIGLAGKGQGAIEQMFDKYSASCLVKEKVLLGLAIERNTVNYKGLFPMRWNFASCGPGQVSVLTRSTLISGWWRQAIVITLQATWLWCGWEGCGTASQVWSFAPVLWSWSM